MSKFQEDLFGCFNDFQVCLFGYCIPCGVLCLQSKAVGMVSGEGMLIPYLLGYFCGVIGNALNRGTFRTRVGIYGSFVGDCCVWWYCCYCAGCQEYREAVLRISTSNNISLGVAFK